MPAPESDLTHVINDRLFDPAGCLLYAPNEGATGISLTACRILAELVASPGTPLPSARLSQAAAPQAASGDAELTRSIAELNRLLGRLPSGALPIELAGGDAYALAAEALENQAPASDPRFRNKPFLRRPATWLVPIALVIALILLAVESANAGQT